jgi:hypothetical protein
MMRDRPDLTLWTAPEPINKYAIDLEMPVFAHHSGMRQPALAEF